MARFLAEKTTSNVTLTYFFQNSADRSSTLASSLVASLLSQILRHEAVSLNPSLRPVLERILPQLQQYNCGHECPILSIWPVFEAMLSSMPSYTLIVDALDECDDPVNEGYLVERLCRLGHMTRSRVILLSRYHAKYETLLLDAVKLTMDSSALKADIMYYARQVITRTTRLQRLQTEILAKIEDSSQGMFLWARLMLDDLSLARTINDQSRRLAGFPKGLDNVYIDCLARGASLMSADDLDVRHEIFTLLVGAIRPFTVQEVSCALALELSCQLDENDLLLDSKHEISRLCWPLATILGEYVQLTHMSVKDFLLKPAFSLASAHKGFGLTTEASNEYLAKKCIAKLNQEECNSLARVAKVIQKNVAPSKCANDKDLGCYGDTDFYEYACLNWHVHLTRILNPKAELLGHVQAFLLGNQFVYWSEILYHITAQTDMGPAVEVRTLLQSWLTMLSLTLGDWDLKASFFYAPYHSVRHRFEADRWQKKDLLPLLCLFRLGEFSNVEGSPPGQTHDFYVTLVEGLKIQLGEEHLLTMKATHRLVVELIALGDYVESEALLSANKTLQHKIIGEEEPDYFVSLEYAGLLSYYLTRFEESARYQAEAHAGLCNLFGPSNKEVLTSKIYWGFTLEAQKRLDEALKILWDVWEAWAPVMGPDNPLSMTTQCAIGAIYRKLRKYSEAKKHLTETFVGRQRIYSLEREVTIDSGLQLALLHREMGDAEEAEALLNVVSQPDIVNRYFERVCQIAHMRALLCMDRQEPMAACQVLRNIFDVAASKGREANNRALLWIRLQLADLLRKIHGADEEALMLFTNLVRPRREPSSPQISSETPRSVQTLRVSETALRLVRDAKCDPAEELLAEHGLEWSRPKDFWILFGGEITDLGWINDPETRET